MDLAKLYERIGGNYEDILSRLTKEERIAKFLGRLESTGDFENLEKALLEKDYETAFRCAHNLKGVSLNLNLGNLSKTSEVLCEELRGMNPQGDVSAMFENVKRDYYDVIEAIREFL